jgi:hypothetical protein
LCVFIPDVSFFTSQFTSPFCGVPNKWFETLYAFTSQIDWEGIRANAFVLRFNPNVIGSTLAGWFRSFSFFAFMSFRVELGASWARDAIFFVKIKDWSGIFASYTFRIGASEERSLKRTLGNVVIGDEVKEVFIVVIDGLISNDPVGSVEIGNIFVVSLGL